MFSSLQLSVEQWRASVPREARLIVSLAALALTLATWTPVLAAGLGVQVAGWEQLVHHSCEPFCHQLPTRSFALAGHLFPLCARCTGMWLGITLGVTLAMVWVPRHRWFSGALMAIGFTAASAFDLLREESTGVALSGVRAVLGFFLFLGVTLAVSFDVLAMLVAGLRGVRSVARRWFARSSA